MNQQHPCSSKSLFFCDEGKSNENTGIDENLKEKESILLQNNQLNKSLEEKAKQHNMTAINVKSFLKYVLQYPNAISTLLDHVQNRKEKENEISILKLTRSKTRQLIDLGAINWPKTPLKRLSSPPKTISPSLAALFDAALSDADSDEDWLPLKRRKLQENDDNNQVISVRKSSSRSSPSDSTFLKTPDIGKYSKFKASKTLTNSQARKQANALEKACRDLSLNWDVEGVLAKRTRSKVPLVDIELDTELDVLDQFLVRHDPDVSVAEQILNSDRAPSPTYLQWLNDLRYGDHSQPTSCRYHQDKKTDEEDNDSEYCFADTEDNDDWEMRHNRATEISKREVKELLADFCEAFNAPNQLDDDDIEEVLCSEPTQNPRHTPLAPIEHTATALDLNHHSYGGTQRFMHTKSQPVKEPFGQKHEHGRYKFKTKNDIILWNDEVSECLLEMSINGDCIKRHKVPFTVKEMLLCKQQLEMHVQLLTQANLIAACVRRNDINLFNEAQCVKQETNCMLEELLRHTLANKNSVVLSAGLLSAYNTSKNFVPDASKTVLPYSAMPLAFANAALRCSALRYPHLLLNKSMRLSASKHLFTEADENLMILGLLQFRGAVQKSDIKKAWHMNKKPKSYRNRVTDSDITLAVCSLISEHMVVLHPRKTIQSRFSATNKSGFSSPQLINDFLLAAQQDILRRNGMVIHRLSDDWPTPLNSNWDSEYTPHWLKCAKLNDRHGRSSLKKQVDAKPIIEIEIIDQGNTRAGGE